MVLRHARALRTLGGALGVSGILFGGLAGCYGTKTLRQPITVEEIAADVEEIRSGQADLRDDVRSMESQLTRQAETIQSLQAENQYLYQELEQKLASIDTKLSQALGSAARPGASGNQPYWSEQNVTAEGSSTDWSGAAPVADSTGEAVVEATSSGDPAVDLSSGAPGARAIVAEGSADADGQSKRVYDQAYLDLTRGNYSLAILGFKEFLRRMPDADISDNAQYWIGESYYMQGDHRQAVREYQKVLDQHAPGDRVASSLYKLGLAKLALGEREAAVDYLRQVYERYPESEEARLSRDKLDTLQ